MENEMITMEERNEVAVEETNVTTTSSSEGGNGLGKTLLVIGGAALIGIGCKVGKWAFNKVKDAKAKNKTDDETEKLIKELEEKGYVVSKQTEVVEAEVVEDETETEEE